MSITLNHTDRAAEARFRAVSVLNGMTGEREVEELEVIASVVDQVLAAAGARRLLREYRAVAELRIARDFDDYIEVDGDDLTDPVTEAVGINAPDYSLDDIDVEMTDTNIRIQARVQATVKVPVVVTTDDPADGADEAIAEMIENGDALPAALSNDGWEVEEVVDTDDIQVSFR